MTILYNYLHYIEVYEYIEIIIMYNLNLKQLILHNQTCSIFHLKIFNSTNFVANKFLDINNHLEIKCIQKLQTEHWCKFEIIFHLTIIIKMLFISITISF
jgi:hypothetical protein